MVLQGENPQTATLVAHVAEAPLKLAQGGKEARKDLVNSSSYLP
jgi:hypothetical protein